MLKGRDETMEFCKSQAPLPAAENLIFSPHQDTLRSSENQNSHKQIDTQNVISKPIVVGKSANNYTLHQLDSIFAITEKREKQIQLAYFPKKIQTDSIKLVSDTLSVKHSTYNFPFAEPKSIQSSYDNFLLNIPKKNLTVNLNTIKIISTDTNTAKVAISSSQKKGTATFFPGKVRAEANMDWFTITIIFSLFVFSLVKIAYQKFIIQIVTGLVDYQVAMRLYREKNVLFKNVSVGLHFIFYINMGLFIFYLFNFYDYPQVFNNNIFLNILIYSVLVLLIYTIKSATSKILGFIFLVHENFSQYIHNVNLYNKNIGLFLFPIIIMYPFSVDKVKPFIIYAGLILLAGMFLLRSFRSAQIIMKKGISLFYLILYLCAVEILPVLLLLKFIKTLI